MRVKNSQPSPVTFELGDFSYTVEPGKSVDIPDQAGPLLARRGVLLEIVETADEEPAPKPKKADKKSEV